MLTRNDGQMKMVVATIEDLMPSGHFLRDLDKYVDFSFIYDKVGHLYSSTGRPSIDPVILIKSVLLGFLYGIESERRIEDEINVNIAYKWFLGLALDEKAPDHCTISQTRRRKFDGNGIFEEIFNEAVRKCIEAGLVTGKTLLVDSTHVKPNVQNDKRETITVTSEPSAYMKKLDEIALREGLVSDAQKRRAEAKTKTKESVKSTTDPDCGILSRPGKPKGFHYLAHQTTDADSGIVTDVFVTPWNECDFTPTVDRIKHQIETFGFAVDGLGADKGYDCTKIHHEMYDLGIKTYIPERGVKQKEVFSNRDFLYDRETDEYICPNGKRLKYGDYRCGNGLKTYYARKSDCQDCALKSKCFRGKGNSKIIAVAYYAHIAREQHKNEDTPRFKEVQLLRKIRCEGNFAIQKDSHNLRRTYKRGHERVTAHCLFSALALNLKRLVRFLKNPHKTTAAKAAVFIVRLKEAPGHSLRVGAWAAREMGVGFTAL